MTSATGEHPLPAPPERSPRSDSTWAVLLALLLGVLATVLIVWSLHVHPRRAVLGLGLFVTVATVGAAERTPAARVEASSLSSIVRKYASLCACPGRARCCSRGAAASARGVGSPRAVAMPARPHRRRDTHATLLPATGVPVKLVLERLGHSTPAFTMTVYQHVLPADQRGHVQSLADAQSKATRHFHELGA